MNIFTSVVYTYKLPPPYQQLLVIERHVEMPTLPNHKQERLWYKGIMHHLLQQMLRRAEDAFPLPNLHL